MSVRRCRFVHPPQPQNWFKLPVLYVADGALVVFLVGGRTTTLPIPQGQAALRTITIYAGGLRGAASGKGRCWLPIWRRCGPVDVCPAAARFPCGWASFVGVPGFVFATERLDRFPEGVIRNLRPSWGSSWRVLLLQTSLAFQSSMRQQQSTAKANLEITLAPVLCG